MPTASGALFCEPKIPTLPTNGNGLTVSNPVAAEHRAQLQQEELVLGDPHEEEEEEVGEMQIPVDPRIGGGGTGIRVCVTVNTQVRDGT